jgi:O-antigen ligase
MIAEEHTFIRICKQTITTGLFFQLAIVPLIIDPFAFDCWYKPKIDSTYALVLVILSAAALAGIAGRIRITFPPFFLCFFLALYAISAIVSTMYSVDRAMSLRGDFYRQEGLITILVYTVLPVLFAALISTGQQAKTFLAGLALSALLIAGWALIQYADLAPQIKPFFGVKVLPGGKAFGSTLGNANFLGKFLVLTSPLLLAFLYLSKSRARAMLGALACSTAVAALILTETRSSWFGFFIAGCIFLITGATEHLLKKKQLLFSMAGLVLAGLAFVVLTSAASGKLTDLQKMITARTAQAFDIGRLRETSSRLFMWKKAIDHIALRPLLGYGPDTHVLIMRQYNQEYVQRFKAKVILDRVHNNYLDVALAQGLFGLFAYCGIVASFLVWLWRALQEEKNAELRLFLCAIFSGCCGYLVNDFFSFSAVSVSPTFWSLMGLSIALKKPGIHAQAPCQQQ